MPHDDDAAISTWISAMPTEMRASLVRQMESWLAIMPAELRSEPMFASADDDEENLSPDDILRHVRTGTPYGNLLLMQALTNSTVEKLTATGIPRDAGGQ